jgi:hypothetical protein
VHGLLDRERVAILTLFDQWAQVDRSHRKLAARGSRLQLVHVSAATARRVLHSEGLVLQGPPPREPAIRAPWPDWVVWKPNSIWNYDFTHFTCAKRVAVAVMDVVSRRWLSTLSRPNKPVCRSRSRSPPRSPPNDSPSASTPGCWLGCAAAKPARPSWTGPKLTASRC